MARTGTRQGAVKVKPQPRSPSASTSREEGKVGGPRALAPISAGKGENRPAATPGADEARARAARTKSGTSRGGPKSEAGKAVAAGNAWKHGLRARKILVCEESAESYLAFRAGMFRQWAPRNESECFLVHRMAGAAWRLMRCPGAEAELLETLRDGEVQGGGLARVFLRDEGLDGDAVVRLARYETALERSYFRCLSMLRLLRLDGSIAAGAAEQPRESGAEGSVPEGWAEPVDAARGIELAWDEDDEPPITVERVILDARPAPRGKLLAMEDVDGEEGPAEMPDAPPEARARAADSGQTGTNADKFPNEPPEPARARHWPGEPERTAPKPRDEPVSRVIGGPLLKSAAGWSE